ncbi:hypothetical protein G7Y89_g10038 [Cudoniella acicularis]|uniref:Uncharacterized protein n=1 Tax=Cudoniella acicularis TaxID=354080 RepID=A0A8H4RFS2_9HELO|nr:hypothetical protein G7Y89_g10038 [Cudoniella acicularis]
MYTVLSTSNEPHVWPLSEWRADSSLGCEAFFEMDVVRQVTCWKRDSRDAENKLSAVPRPTARAPWEVVKGNDDRFHVRLYLHPPIHSGVFCQQTSAPQREQWNRARIFSYSPYEIRSFARRTSSTCPWGAQDSKFEGIWYLSTEVERCPDSEQRVPTWCIVPRASFCILESQQVPKVQVTAEFSRLKIQKLVPKESGNSWTVPPLALVVDSYVATRYRRDRTSLLLLNPVITTISGSATSQPYQAEMRTPKNNDGKLWAVGSGQWACGFAIVTVLIRMLAAASPGYSSWTSFRARVPGGFMLCCYPPEVAPADRAGEGVFAAVRCSSKSLEGHVAKLFMLTLTLTLAAASACERNSRCPAVQEIRRAGVDGRGRDCAVDSWFSGLAHPFVMAR